MNAINRTVTTVIDHERCTGCGLCVAVCPKGTISLRDEQAWVTGDESMNCGHCAAVCPEKAVTVTGLEPALSAFGTFNSPTEWLPYGSMHTGLLVQLMRSRRSCRNYLVKPVEPAVLDDLVKIGITAPSGSNCQLWSFTILPNRHAVLQLGERIGRFFKRMNRLAEKAWLRHLLSLVGQHSLSSYHANHYQSVRTAILQWETEGVDHLFHGAPAAIIVSSRNDASCPAEDALLATQNILLAAHSMGLGTCLIGYAIEVMRRDRRLNRYVGLPDNETAYAVIALGYPAETYTTVTGRRRARVRYFNSEMK